MKRVMLAAVLVIAPVAMANLVEMSLDSQVNIGLGDAIISQGGGTIMFPGAEGEDMGVQMNITPGGGWWYGPRVYFTRAGYGPLDLSAPGTEFRIDAKAFQAATNTNPYGDCNIFVRLYSGAADFPSSYRDFGLVYGPNATAWPYGDWGNWNQIVIDVNTHAYTDAGGFDITAVTQVRLYGTNWTGHGDDWIAAKDLVITPEPGALVLLGLGLLGLRRR